MNDGTGQGPVLRSTSWRVRRKMRRTGLPARSASWHAHRKGLRSRPTVPRLVKSSRNRKFWVGAGTSGKIFYCGFAGNWGFQEGVRGVFLDGGLSLDKIALVHRSPCGGRELHGDCTFRSMPSSDSHPLISFGQQSLVLPSMLLCDFGNLEREIRQLEAAGFHGLHLDVMDGVFVPNFSYGLPIVRAFRRLTDLPLDVHLMMVNPGRYVGEFRAAGADLISFHAEAVEDPVPVVAAIRGSGAGVGMALNPSTPVARVLPVLDDLDFVLLMTVQAGFGGQSFQAGPLSKIEELRRVRPDLWIEVDGGVNAETIGTCCRAGANGLVVGSAIFNGRDYAQTHRALQAEMNGRRAKMSATDLSNAAVSGPISARSDC